MKFLLIVVAVILIDRAIPYGFWGYGSSSIEIDEREFLSRYGLLSFPRTLFGIGVCAAAGLDLIVAVNNDLQALLTISLTVLFVVAALADVWKARK